METWRVDLAKRVLEETRRQNEIADSWRAGKVRKWEADCRRRAAELLRRAALLQEEEAAFLKIKQEEERYWRDLAVKEEFFCMFIKEEAI